MPRARLRSGTSCTDATSSTASAPALESEGYLSDRSSDTRSQASVDLSKLVDLSTAQETQLSLATTVDSQPKGLVSQGLDEASEFGDTSISGISTRSEAIRSSTRSLKSISRSTFNFDANSSRLNSSSYSPSRASHMSRHDYDIPAATPGEDAPPSVERFAHNIVGTIRASSSPAPAKMASPSRRSPRISQIPKVSYFARHGHRLSPITSSPRTRPPSKTQAKAPRKGLKKPSPKITTTMANANTNTDTNLDTQKTLSLKHASPDDKSVASMLISPSEEANDMVVTEPSSNVQDQDLRLAPLHPDQDHASTTSDRGRSDREPSAATSAPSEGDPIDRMIHMMDAHTGDTARRPVGKRTIPSSFDEDRPVKRTKPLPRKKTPINSPIQPPIISPHRSSKKYAAPVEKSKPRPPPPRAPIAKDPSRRGARLSRKTAMGRNGSPIPTGFHGPFSHAFRDNEPTQTYLDSRVLFDEVRRKNYVAIPSGRAVSPSLKEKAMMSTEDPGEFSPPLPPSRPVTPFPSSAPDSPPHRQRKPSQRSQEIARQVRQQFSDDSIIHEGSVSVVGKSPEPNPVEEPDNKLWENAVSSLETNVEQTMGTIVKTMMRQLKPKRDAVLEVADLYYAKGQEMIQGLVATHRAELSQIRREAEEKKRRTQQYWQDALRDFDAIPLPEMFDWNQEMNDMDEQDKKMKAICAEFLENCKR